MLSALNVNCFHRIPILEEVKKIKKIKIKEEEEEEEEATQNKSLFLVFRTSSKYYITLSSRLNIAFFLCLYESLFLVHSAV